MSFWMSAGHNFLQIIDTKRNLKSMSNFVVSNVPANDLFVVLVYVQDQGAVSIRKTVLPGMAIPMLKIRRPNGRLIFNMEITIRR